eukprot:11224304-Lingulodinium_polyedra.AAC.1
MMRARFKAGSKHERELPLQNALRNRRFGACLLWCERAPIVSQRGRALKLPLKCAHANAFRRRFETLGSPSARRTSRCEC